MAKRKLRSTLGEKAKKPLEGAEAKEATRLSLEAARLKRRGGRPAKHVCSILCPGPSLREHSYFPGRKIAVTDALFHPIFDEGCDIWSFQEGPNHKFQPRYQRYGPRFEEVVKAIWTVKGARAHWIHKWEINLAKVSVIDDMKVEDMTFPYTPNAWMNGGKTKPHADNSFFYALARSIHEGFKKIHIFGADMEGTANYDPRNGEPIGYPVPPLPSRMQTKGWWIHRWKIERPLLEAVVNEARENGLEIHLEVPTPAAA